MFFIGVDPALLSGAIGVISEGGDYLDCFMIENDLKSKNKKKPEGDSEKADTGRINAKKLHEQLTSIKDRFGDNALIIIEDVFSMPNQSSVAQARFMRAVGAIEALCQISGFDVVLLTPTSWKRYMQLTKDKEKSLDLARQLFPTASLKKAKDHNLAEALLLAECGRRKKLNSINRSEK